MLHRVSLLARPSVVVAALALAMLQVAAPGQSRVHERPGSVGDPSPAAPSAATVFSTVVDGRVLGPDGAPAAGAVVVTSAGGQVVSDAGRRVLARGAVAGEVIERPRHGRTRLRHRESGWQRAGGRVGALGRHVGRHDRSAGGIDVPAELAADVWWPARCR